MSLWVPICRDGYAYVSIRIYRRQSKYLTSWCWLSVLLHSSFRFSSSHSPNRNVWACERWTATPTKSGPGCWSSVPGNWPALPVSMSTTGSPLLYSAHRLRMVSSLCLSWTHTHTHRVQNQGGLLNKQANREKERKRKTNREKETKGQNSV